MPEFLISFLNGKLAVRTDPNLFPFCGPWNSTSFLSRSPVESERIDRFLSSEFVSRLAAKLWRGDSGASVNDAISLIHECSKGLALRKSPLWDVELGGSQSAALRSDSRFWKTYPLETIIEIAAAAGHSEQSKGAAERAFSIIENARATLGKKLKPPNEGQTNDSPTILDRRSLRNSLASQFIEDFKPHWVWRHAAKRVTGIKRLDRAENAFLRFLRDPSVCGKASLSNNILKLAIASRRKQGFSLHEVQTLQNAFKDWHQRWVKSRQSDSGKRVGVKNFKKKSG